MYMKNCDIAPAKSNAGNPLTGLKILYLGSSVTNGSAAGGASFAECIAERNGTKFVKEAVNGTTLADGRESYVERLCRLGNGGEFDLFIFQLSMNDATQGKPIGAPSLTDKPDTSTVCGAIEYIIAHVRETWACPVMFYTNSYYDNANYGAMVGALHKIAELYGIGVIDLYRDEEFNDISEEQRKIYMADAIHPTKRGYAEWWTPKMEKCIIDYIKGR
jgi:lysophospholipase L1-like esterase